MSSLISITSERSEIIPAGFAELVLGTRTIVNLRGQLPPCERSGFCVQRLSISVEDQLLNQEHVYSRLDPRRFDDAGNPLQYAPIA